MVPLNCYLTPSMLLKANSRSKKRLKYSRNLITVTINV